MFFPVFYFVLVYIYDTDLLYIHRPTNLNYNLYATELKNEVDLGQNIVI